jgi:hypothetical protein
MGGNLVPHPEGRARTEASENVVLQEYLGLQAGSNTRLEKQNKMERRKSEYVVNIIGIKQSRGARET